jgi:hypothetical protein
MNHNYIQMRFQKVKGLSCVAQVMGHIDRTSKESKSKVDCTKSNLNIYNSSKGCSGSNLVDEWKLKRSQFPKRKNGVDMLEVVITCSDDSMVDPAHWHSDVVGWAVRSFGKDAILQIATHRDETRLHSHVTFLPIVIDSRTQKKN